MRNEGYRVYIGSELHLGRLVRRISYGKASYVYTVGNEGEVKLWCFHFLFYALHLHSKDRSFRRRVV